MKAFIFEGEMYIRCIPAKTLFHSTLVHEVVNRGDIFALRVSDQKLTIIKGLSIVEHIEVDVAMAPKKDTKTVAAMKKQLPLSQQELEL